MDNDISDRYRADIDALKLDIIRKKITYTANTNALKEEIAGLNKYIKKLKSLPSVSGLKKLAKEIHEQCQNGASVSDIIHLLTTLPDQCPEQEVPWSGQIT